MRLLIASLQGDPGIGAAIARILGADHAVFHAKRFPDGESYVRLEPPGDYDIVVVVNTMYPGQNDRFVELLLGTEAVRGLGAKPVIVAPYLAYSRQDRRFLPGEPVSVTAVLRSLAAAGAAGLATVDVHKPSSLEAFPGPSINIDPAPAFARTLRGIVDDDTVVIAPDRGAVARASRLASLLGLEHDFLEKTRDRVTGEVSYRPRRLQVRGRKALVVDDIISTGGTIAKTAEILYSQGAVEVMVACSHGLFVSNALEKLRDRGVQRIYAANTVPLPSGVEKVDVSQEIAEAVKNLVQAVWQTSSHDTPT